MPPAAEGRLALEVVARHLLDQGGVHEPAELEPLPPVPVGGSRLASLSAAGFLNNLFRLSSLTMSTRGRRTARRTVGRARRRCSPSATSPSAPGSARGCCGCGRTGSASPSPPGCPAGTGATATVTSTWSATCVARQQSGLRLEQAIAAVRALQQLDEPSVFAAVRDADPRLPRQRLRKSTLIALSWAIEDEMCAHGTQGFAFGAFQRGAVLRARRLAVARPGPPLAARDGARGVRRRVRRACPAAPASRSSCRWCREPRCARSGRSSATRPRSPRSSPRGSAPDRRRPSTRSASSRSSGRSTRCPCAPQATSASTSPRRPERCDDVAVAPHGPRPPRPLAAPPSPQAVTEFCDRVIGQFDERGRR